MKEMPLVLASTQPPKKTAFATAPSATTMRPGRASTRAPQPSWIAATIVKVITAWRCSLCTPMAAAWMAPAPSDAAPPTASQPSAPRAATRMGRTELARDASCSPLYGDGHVGTPFYAGGVYVPDVTLGGVSGPLGRAPQDRQTAHVGTDSSGGADRDEHVAGDRAVDDVHEARRHRPAAPRTPRPCTRRREPRPWQHAPVPRQGGRRAPGRSRSSHTGRALSSSRSGPRSSVLASGVRAVLHAVRAGRTRAGPSSGPRSGRGHAPVSSCTTSTTRCDGRVLARAVGDRDPVRGLRAPLAEREPARPCASGACPSATW